VYPNLWLYDGLLMPEALAGLLVALALLVSVRFLRTGRTSLLVWLGVIIGLGALTRGELLFLLPLLALPICLARREQTMPSRLRLAGLATVVTALVIAPWAIYNLQRFERPVFISTAEETTTGGANCDAVYHGSQIGAWSESCFDDILARNLEESVAASEIRDRTVHYVRAHASRVPLVALARVGRTWDLFKPGDNVTLGELQRRPRAWSWIAFALYWALIPLAVFGGYVLRRDRALLALLAMPALVTLTGVLFWGNPRFRRPAELVIVVLAAVAIDALLARRTTPAAIS
jgi:4-amino-4-deoxy-L-arabinose transferase-like glycosyltransferase